MRRTRSTSVGQAIAALVCSATGFLITLTACSETTRYRVLSFFLDGVPHRDAGQIAETSSESEEFPPPDLTEQPRVVHRYYAHTPYRENRCGGCHSIETGQLVRSIEDGLCVTCHSRLVADDRFVHGPVAVTDCTVCHHHHTAAFPNLLLASVSATCGGCHDSDDVDEDYHTTIDSQSCTECHDPHGGQDRFFLRTERTTP